jgi:hypothetical protein
MIGATKEDIEKVGHPDWSAQFPPEAGGGYIAATIGSHQLHCLHYIWQDHYMSYFPKTQDKKQRVPELYELHCTSIGLLFLCFLTSLLCAMYWSRLRRLLETIDSISRIQKVHSGL